MTGPYCTVTLTVHEMKLAEAQFLGRGNLAEDDNLPIAAATYRAIAAKFGEGAKHPHVQSSQTPLVTPDAALDTPVPYVPTS